jgi:pimeloyl-ACP methyl ester carboxylesterase
MRNRVMMSLGLLASAAGCGDVVSYRPPADASVDNGAVAVIDRPAAAKDRGVERPTDLGTNEDAGAAPVDAPAAIDAGATEVDVSAPDAAPPPVDAGGRDLSERGPYLVATWTGAIAGTATTARAFYPTASDGRLPLVIFAHGFQLAVGNYDGLLSHVASWGYVVVSIDYPGTLLSVDHRNVPRAMIAARTALALGVAGFPATGRIDANRTAVMGHSLGAKGAIMALLDEPAFVAGVALDPVDDNPSPIGGVSDATPSIAPEQMGRLTRPLALFGATQSRCVQLGQACAPEGSNYLRFAAAAPAGARVGLYPLSNFGHNDFVDTACGFQCSLCARGAAPLDSRARALRFLSVAFLERYVRGDESLQAYVVGAGREAFVASGALWDGRTATLPRCP